MKLQDFKSKQVYLVGGSSGIGLAMAEKLVRAGAHLVLFSRNETLLQKVKHELIVSRVCEQQRVDYRVLDVANHEAVDHVMAESVKVLGVPDVLINCAGRALPDHVENIQYDQFEETFRINLFGIRNTVHALLPHMKKRGGLIINTASLAGLIGVFGYSDYCASKFAIIGYSEALRSELKKYNIRVSVLCPPDTDTPGFHNENKTKPAETHAISAGASLLTPEKVARIFFKELPRNRLLVIPGHQAKFSHVMKRLFPRLVELVMDRDVKRAAG